MKTFLRIAIAFLLPMLLPAVTAAQEPAVKRVCSDPIDLSAAKYLRKDLNDKACALVKVQIVADGVEFFGNTVGSVERKAGEYWVYMTDGTKMLRIQSNSFIPVDIRFPDYGIPALASNNTYIITLEMPAAAVAPSAKAGLNYLIMTVSPTDAKVIVDGKPREVKHGQSKILLKNGTYGFLVESPGYISEEGTVTINNARLEKSVTLRSSKGSLSIATTTPGTEIYINGDKVAAGSWTGQLLPDTYSIEGRLQGYHTAEIIQTVAMGESHAVTIPGLTPRTGSLNIDYEPTGAKITIDGKEHGVTPDVIDDLIIGPHSVTISHEGFADKTMTVDIAESQTTDLSGKLDETKSIVLVEEYQAHFPGGDAELLKFLAKNIVYPKSAIEKDIQGTVVVGFDVEKDGSLSNIRILRGMDPDLDKEALRVVGLIPNFIPGYQNGINVKQPFTLPVKFKLIGDKKKKKKN